MEYFCIVLGKALSIIFEEVLQALITQVTRPTRCFPKLVTKIGLDMLTFDEQNLLGTCPLIHPNFGSGRLPNFSGDVVEFLTS